MESDWYPNDNGNGYYTSKETLYSDGFTVDPSDFIDSHRSISSNLGEAASVLAESVIGAPYILGGKGWDLNKQKFVESTDIFNGYTYWDADSQTQKFGSGIDCSGLVYWSYNKAAGLQDSPVNIPDQCPVYFEGASGQWSDTKCLEKLGGPTDIPSIYDLKTGDLLFLQNTETPTSGIDHVGMYVGDGEVVHAKGPNDTGHIEKITLSDWLILPTSDGKKYKDHFAGYGRIISHRWDGMSGVLASRPVTLRSDSDQNHILVKGGDNGLWDNVDGTWQEGLGGVITSEPCAVKDGMGLIHIFVIGTDGALWDRVLGADWACLGGYITYNPSAALSPDGQIKIAVKGSDNALWIKDFTTGSWSPLGGYITSNPQMIYDSQGRMHIFARGGDGALWDYAGLGGGWQPLGGQITSDAIPVQNPFNPYFIYIYARGGDGALWVNKFNINTAQGDWQGLGGFISPTNGGCPSPVVDADGIIHTFVQGGDGALWDNANGAWYCLRGRITTDPNAIRDKNGRLRVAVRGGDDALWVNTVGINRIPITLVGPNACDYTKIQPAVDASPSGGIIKVLSGTYTENVQIDKSLTIIGAGADKTIVDGNQANSVFTIGKNDQNIDVSLSGMTIQNGRAFSGGHGFGGGIYSQGRLTISDSSISRNSAYYYGGGIGNIAGTVTITGCNINNNIDGGILNHGTGTATITNSDIFGNSATWGAGIANEGTISITSCDIHENTANGANGFGGGIGNGGTATIKDCNIYRNSVTIYGQQGFGGGIGIGSSATTTIEDCKIYGNSAYIGAGVGSHGTVTIERSDVYGNTGSWGGGICIREGTGTVKDNNIYENLIGTDVNGGCGGGIANWGTVDVIGSKIRENTAQQGFLNGGALYNGGTATIKDSIISDNIGNEGGGIYNSYIGGDMNNGAKLTISGTTQITNNQVTMDNRGYGGYGGGIEAGSLNNVITFDGPNVAVKFNKAQFPSPSELNWYQGWGIYTISGEPTTINGFDPSTQVTGNTKI